MSVPQTRAQIARVAVAAPLDKTLSYRIPATLRGAVQVGSRVQVPLGRRQAVGFVMDWSDGEGEDLKEIVALLDEKPLFHAGHAAFYQRAADYYAYPVGEAVRTALPAGLAGRGSQPQILTDRLYTATLSPQTPRGARQREILAFITDRGPTPLSLLRQHFDAPHAPLNRLVELELLQVETIQRSRDPFLGSLPVVPAVQALNADQQQALVTLFTAIDDLPTFNSVLLRGVTGSGKTEVYLRAIARTLERGFQALVMVPEIALTPQFVARFRGRFSDSDTRLAVLHSGLSDGERYDAWRAVAAGEIDVVIGARSAIFAPLPKLGLIVVDEEHDGSYKQSEAFRYNARDLALMRAQKEQALVILGSATPALTSYQRTAEGRFTGLQLETRAGERPMPSVELVDLTTEEFEGSFSPTLQQALSEALAAGEQALLLLNRRGYAPYLLCQDCGATPRCPNCDITLTFSLVERSLRCHYCDFRQPPPQTCELCGGEGLFPEGAGTERLEEEVARLWPDARVARMDRDTTTRKGAHGRLIERMAAGEIDILIGTQMIAKGHDFPEVTLVGVLNADTALNLPDFRSAERVFALLSQVAGRAGRGDRPGRVLIQTYAADHYALDFVTRHDYVGFAETELAYRRELGYPPFGHLVNLVLAGNDQERVAQSAETLAGALGEHAAGVEVLGPAPCLLARLRGKHRMQVLLKAAERPYLRRLVDWLRSGAVRISPGVSLQIDVDPVDMF